MPKRRNPKILSSPISFPFPPPTYNRLASEVLSLIPHFPNEESTLASLALTIEAAAIEIDKLDTIYPVYKFIALVVDAKDYINTLKKSKEHETGTGTIT